MKRWVVVVCALLLSAGLASPAHAAPSKRVPPGPPTAVTLVAGKTPAQAVLTWSPPTDSGSNAVFGYSIVKESTEGTAIYWNAANRDVHAGYARTFANLEVGITYRFKIWTWTRAGKSDPVIAYYTPATAGPAVYSVDAATGNVVRVPAAGGSPVVIATGVTADNLITNAAGDLYFTDATTSSIKKVAAGATTATTFATGVGGTIGVDTFGNVYAAAGSDLVKIDPAGVKTVVYTAPDPFTYLAVSPDGTVTIEYPRRGQVESTFITVPVTGSPTSRLVDCNSYCLGDLRTDTAGTLYVWTVATGGSGSVGWERVAPGATAASTDDPSLAGFPGRAVGALSPTGVFYTVPTTLACFGSAPPPESGNTPCVPDPAVTTIQRLNPDGTLAPAVQVSGFSLPDALGFDLHDQGADVAIDTTGNTYLATSQGIVRFNSTGGPATTVATGNYQRIAVTN